MKTILSRVLLSGALLVGIASVSAQEPTFDPSLVSVLNPDKSSLQAPPSGTSANRTALSLALKLAVWPYSFIAAQDGNVYSGTVVGGSPFNRGARTTSIPVVMIPLRVQFTGTVRNFDPTSPDDGCLGVGNTALTLTEQSPVWTPTSYTINGVPQGTVTFPDAVERAMFWPQVSGFASAWHLGLNVSVAAKQTISVPNNGTNGATFTLNGGCSTNSIGQDNPPRLGVVSIGTIDPLLNTIIASLGLTPNQFPFFVIYGVVISNGAASNLNNCCILGYHNGSGVPSAPGQTYGIAEYDQGFAFGPNIQDVAPMSHEVMEWINDPSGNNPTPPWGHLGQVKGCQSNLEAGDPLSGTLMPGVAMPNGKTYHTQEIPFFSWFLGAPFAGAGGKYSSNGTFGGFAKLCPPGGTN